MNDPELRDELIALLHDDDRVRARLAADGALSDGYNAEMAAVHRHNAHRIRAIVADRGWPGEAEIGEDGMLALWRIVQHAIGDPYLQRAFLAHMNALAGTPDDLPVERAMLDDRIRFFEGRPQRYGTQFDWNAAGELTIAGELEDPHAIDERRAAIGLPPLADAVAHHRAATAAAGELAPRDMDAHRAGFEAWLRETGWR